MSDATDSARPVCGNALPDGTRVGEFERRHVVGVEGFGIVHLAFDHGLDPLLGALEVLHREAVHHRDIAPDDIVIGKDGAPMQLDFGSARHVVIDRCQTLTAILEPSHAPIEQYGESGGIRQGACAAPDSAFPVCAGHAVRGLRFGAHRRCCRSTGGGAGVPGHSRTQARAGAQPARAVR